MKLAGKKKDKPAPRVEKKAKRKSSRGAGDGLAKLKSFVANHIEKLLLAAMAAFALLLIYTGFSKEALQTDPDSVAAEISRAQNSINSPTWAQVKQERQPEPDRFDQKAELDTISIDVNAYAMNVPFHPRLQEQGKKRSDPELLAPFSIEVRAGYGALAIKSTGQDSNIAEVVERTSTDLRPIPPEMSTGRMEAPLGGTYESRHFVAITGLVPYKRQFDLYVEAFQGAAEYSPERDVPTYRGLYVERAEVQSDGSLADWQPLDTIAGMIQEPRRWETSPDETADPNHLLRGLIMRIPPLVMRDVSQWSRHSTVPVVQADDLGRAVEEGRGGEEAGEAEEGDGGWEDFGSGVRGESRRSSSGPRSRALSAAEGRSEGTGTELAEPELKVDNGMLRYFDFTVEPGKRYRYRVQAQLVDPNNPADGPKPSIANCETEVVVRRQTATDSYRRTAWSEPSDAISVPRGQRVLAAAAEAVSTVWAEPERRVLIERRPNDEPMINVLTLTWKADGPYDVPVPAKVGRGAVLNGTTPKTEVIDPSAARVRSLANYRFTTDAIVLDVYPGLSTPGSDLPSPGFALVRTSDGRLELHGELEDLPLVQKNTIPPPEEELRPNRGEEPRGGPRRRGDETRLGEPTRERTGRRSGNP